ncbi:MAG: TIGR03545 family protein [Treponemataceae bacterium]|nr:TIGR03545 family protein [Treponemataceae bacterium]
MAKDNEQNAAEEKKTPAAAVKKDAPAKKKKAPKLVPAKKLPKLYRKRYTKESLEKKLLKKLYIDADRTLVEDLYVPAEDKKGRAIMRIPPEKMVPQPDFNRCKLIAKQVKLQKSGINLVPLLAVVILIAGIGICVTLFKNVVVKKAITSAMQGIFQAKTDIGLVDVQIFGASLEIRDLQQANKDSPMKNIFQIDTIHFDFNLTELLRGKFDAENLVVAGVALDTDRTTSGEIPVKKQPKEEQKTESALSAKTKELQDAAVAQLTELFENYNPETLLAGLQEELRSPAAAAEIAADVQEKIAKWQAVPAELQDSIASASSSVNAVIKTNWGGINDVAKLKSALETVNNAGTELKNLTSTVEKTTSGLKEDSADVAGYAASLQTAITSDTALLEAKITEMKNMFSPDSLKNVMNNAVESMLYTVLGDYYPYVSKAMNAAMSIQANSAAKPADQTAAEKKKAAKEAQAKKKSEGRRRLDGRTIYYKKDTVPKFLIQNAVASGYEYKTDNLLFEGTATEISSDQNIRGKPAAINADFKIAGRANSASVVIDARSASTAPLVTAQYTGNGYPIAADAQVFKLTSASDISAKLTAAADGSFSVGGNLDMHISEMTGMEFEPEKICTLYKKALAGISRLSVGFTIGYDAARGVIVAIENPETLARQLVEPVVIVLQDEITAIAADAKTKVAAMLSEKTNGATDKLAQFNDIQGAIDAQKDKLNDITAQLEAKKKELNAQIEAATKQAAANAVNQLIPGAAGSSSSSSSASSAASSAANALKGLLKK